ncbi:MAG: hypothetical protein JO027_00605 [Solirubrobacterales bacterium]|nr:hypothetical protein [Solirubrobacterales bacterium]
MTALRTLSFGNGSLWGASWSAGSPETSLCALGAGAETVILPGVRPSENGTGDGDWRLDGDGVALIASPAGQLVDVPAVQDTVSGWDQLCRVTGSFGEHEVDCLGLRSAWADGVELSRFESIRAVSVWFDPDEALALTAFRPRKGKGHEADLLAASVIAADRSAAAEDPRLSTTYGADGWPSRAGLELWLSAGEDADSERQFPRRASGEAIGARAQALAGELELRAEPFRWHSRSRDGAGMYILARRQ